MDIARAPYTGLSRKLVVALDIGTTFSGAAYALLDPGEVPQIQPVTRQIFPVSDPVTDGDEREIGTQTPPTLGPQKSPPYCTTITTAIFAGLRAAWTVRMDAFLKIRW
jgi:hypothetical protein